MKSKDIRNYINVFGEHPFASWNTFKFRITLLVRSKISGLLFWLRVLSWKMKCNKCSYWFKYFWKINLYAWILGWLCFDDSYFLATIWLTFHQVNRTKKLSFKMRVCAFLVLVILLHGSNCEKRSLRKKRDTLNIIYNNDCKYFYKLEHRNIMIPQAC